MSRDTHTDDTLPTVVTDSSLSCEEQADLVRLTRIVRKGAKTFIEVGNALMEICQRKLYRKTHDTFSAFCEAEFGFKKRRAYQLISAAKAAAEHPEIDFDNERATRQFLQEQNEAGGEGEGEPSEGRKRAGEAGRLATKGKPRNETGHYRNARSGFIRTHSLSYWDANDKEGAPHFSATEKRHIIEQAMAAVPHWPVEVLTAVSREAGEVLRQRGHGGRREKRANRELEA
ncbi:MAG: hypothetical protein LBK99_15565 [Opitutaceae bacterium]|nr:hypothetical protein [Opitutaceae bacterium]